MPWLSFASMEGEDLKAVYAFLRARKPAYNAVDSHPMSLVSRAPPADRT